MIDFPNSPTVGQVVTSPNGTAWRWTGSTWLLGTAASAGGARGRVAYAVQASVAGVTTLIDLMSVTFTASPNRTYRTTVFVHPSSTVTNDDLVVTINDGGGAQVQFAYAPYLDPAVSSTMSVSVVETGLSGTITRKARGGRQAGTGTLTFYSAPTSPAFILVEDITYDAGPGGAAGGGGGFASLPVTVNADQTGFTTANADMTGFATTINVIDRRLYEVTFLFNTSQNATGGYQTINMVFGATAITVSSAWVPATAWIMHSGAVQFVGGASTGSLQGVPVGATVIKMQGRTNGGIMTVNSGSIVNGRFAVKDVGPVPN